MRWAGRADIFLMTRTFRAYRNRSNNEVNRYMHERRDLANRDVLRNCRNKPARDIVAGTYLC